MRKIKLILLDIISYLGSLLLLCALILSLFLTGEKHTIAIEVMQLLAILMGIVSLVFTFVYSHKAYHLFIGLFLICCGVFDYLLVKDIIPQTIYQWWPFLGVIVGIIVFITGMYKYKKVKMGFVIPALSVFLFGLWLMLFSFKVIKVSFTLFALIGAPLFMILTCIFMVAIMFIQQKYKTLVIKDDGSGSFDDDELTVDKSGE